MHAGDDADGVRRTVTARGREQLRSALLRERQTLKVALAG
jgi:hypothetical protein